MKDAPAGRAPTGDAARDANLLGALVLAVSERVEHAAREAAAHGGAAPAALVALASFLDGSSIDTLRRPLGLTHSAAVRLVDRLAAAGLVTREAGEDARSVAVFLTPAGHRAAEQVQQSRMEALSRVLDALSPGEREQLSALHERLLDSLTSGRTDARHICRMCDSHACGHHEARCPVTRAADRAEAALATAS
jgi:MarR family transcriptional regulator, negative regulator of the multidrug operon emrRAB